MSEISILKNRAVTGREMIAIIREAFAFRDPAFITARNISIPIEIANFDDDDARDIDTERTIEVALPSLVSRIDIDNESLSIEIISKRFKMQFEAKVIDRTDGFIKLLVPNTANVSNVRNAERINLRDQNFYDGIISQSGKVTPCLIQFTDLTADALGIRLLIEFKLDEKNSNIFLHTKVQSEEFEFSKPANLIRIQLIKSSQSYYEYAIGLKTEVSEASEEKTERAKRFDFKVSMHCTIPSTNSKIVFEVSDLSASGFRAVKCIPNLPWISQGVTVVEDTTGISFSIVRKDSAGSIALKIIGNQDKDYIKWNNFALPIISSGRIASSAHDARSLINTFLEAGGSLVDNLAYKRNATTQKQCLNFLTTQTDLMFRWVNINETGSILGHHSTYRVGMNSWFTGDIVGAQSKEKKLDSEFIRKNFHALGDALTSMVEPQTIFGSWKFGHAYWRKWREYMISNNHVVAIQKYDNISKKDLTSNISSDLFKSTNFEQLSNSNYFKFLEAISMITNPSSLKILGGLDITSTGIFINGTNSIYKNDEIKGFRREPFYFQYKEKSFIGVLSQLPTGTTINGVFDCIFIFPIKKETDISYDDRKELYSLVMMYGLSRGFRVNSIRAFIENEEAVGTLSEFIMFTPEGFRYYYR